MVYWYIWYLLTYLSLNRGLLTTYTWKIEGILLAVPDGTMKIYWKLCVQVIVQPDDEGPGYDVSSMLFNCSLLVVNKGQRSLLMSQPATSWMSFFANFLMDFTRGRILTSPHLEVEWEIYNTQNPLTTYLITINLPRASLYIAIPSE